MKKPYTIKETEAELLCPDCGSKNVEHDETVDVKRGSGVILKQYKCKDCKISFIPAMTGTTAKRSDIDKWANKGRTYEGMNEGRSWDNEQKQDCIIIRKK